MITFDFIKELRNMCSTQIDLYLHFLRNVDWNCCVRSSVEESAMAIQSKVRWVRKQIKKGVSKGHLAIDGNNPDNLIFNLTTSSVDFDKFTTKYSKLYTFFYTNAFRSLSVNGKRILIMAAYYLSTQLNQKNKPRNVVRLHYSEILSRLPLDETKLQREIVKLQKAIHQSSDEKLPILAITLHAAKDIKGKVVSYVEFRFEDNALNSFYENHTEARLLECLAYHQQFDLVWEKGHYEEILKVAKHLFTSLGKEERQLARKIYNDALEDLFASLRYKDPMAPDALAAYFSKIIHEKMKEEILESTVQLGKRENLANFIRNTFEYTEIDTSTWIGFQTNLYTLDDFAGELQKLRNRIRLLTSLCINWVEARVKSIQKLFDREAKDRVVDLINEEIESTKGKISNRWPEDTKGVLGAFPLADVSRKLIERVQDYINAIRSFYYRLDN
ncbi:hypothetical protein QO009_003088 [Brevibacillus aydinogluensis]|jgi:hypothetical protein|uniref:hypothetical protein n=1 Tax=Brevibacillus aydinogluensis TaxID=927786 RepID=UPI002892FE7A|nr:hypothetical protein [Brevibacillus aydinogluensis]MDT3417193.1 hypothetical protein [Brevibacillus aydinogluensis]